MATDYASLLGNSTSAYSDILNKYEQRIGGLKASADVLGQNQLQQASNYWEKQAADVNQGVYGRGLANSTISNALQGGVSQQRAYDFGQINNSINAQKLGLEQQAGLDFLTAYERANQGLVSQGQFGQSLGLQYAQLGQQGRQFQQQLDFQREQANRNPYAYGGGGGGGGTTWGDGGDGGNTLVNMANAFSASNQAWSMGGDFGGDWGY